MLFDILTLFPAMFEGPMSESILQKALERGLISLKIHDIRQEADDKHKTADDAPFGGGPGMVLLAKPVITILQRLKRPESKTIFMCPSGRKLTDKKARELSSEEHLIIICGHYEGIDARIDECVDEEISIGDYVLTGGEMAAAVLVDSISRYIPGVVKEAGSVEADSFSNNLIDFPHYTRPADLDGRSVPEALLSGHHEEIRKWRRKKSLERTLIKRPDLLAQASITDEDKILLKEIVLGN